MEVEDEKKNLASDCLTSVTVMRDKQRHLPAAFSAVMISQRCFRCN